MMVAMNMAVVARFKNPLRLSSFVDQVLLRNKSLSEGKNEYDDDD